MARFLVVLIVALASCAPTPQATPPVAAVNTSQSPFLSLINAERAALGRGPLQENARLSRAAQAHAADMVANGYFAHEGRNGSTFVQRARAVGYTCPIAENLANGQRTAQAVVQAWMDSPGHRRNILLREAKEFGIGRSGNMWALTIGHGC